MRTLSLFFLIALGSHLFGDTIPDGYKKEDEFLSDTQETFVRSYRGKPDDWTGELQFRVFRKENPASNGYLLWKGRNRASALVSSDGENIAINHHAMSDLGLLYIFTRQKDGTYKQLDINFDTLQDRLLKNALGKNKEPFSDHNYCYASTWLNKQDLLIGLTAVNSGEYEATFWCILNCNTKEIFYDLGDINKSALHYFKNTN